MSSLKFGYLKCARCEQLFEVDKIGGYADGKVFCDACYALPLGQMCNKCFKYSIKDSKCLVSGKIVSPTSECTNIHVKMGLIEKDVVQ